MISEIICFVKPHSMLYSQTVFNLVSEREVQNHLLMLPRDCYHVTGVLLSVSVGYNGTVVCTASMFA